MAAFNEYSIGNLASSISRNKVLLTDLFLSNEPVYYSQLSGDRYKGCNITELIDLHLVDVPGKEIVTLTPEFRELISKAFNIIRIVTDHDVMRYKEKLEQDIEDYHTAHDYRRDMYLRYVKNDLADIMKAMESSVDELNAAVEREFKYIGNDELKKKHLERYLQTNKKLRDLRNKVNSILEGVSFQQLQRDANDGELDLFTSVCLIVFQQKGTELLKLLNTINLYISDITKRIADIEKIHRIKALRDEGKLSSPEYSNLEEYVSTDTSLWHEPRTYHSYHLSQKTITESPQIAEMLKAVRLQMERDYMKSIPAGPVDDIYENEVRIDRRKSNPKDIINQFLPSGKDLFTFIEDYDFGQHLTLNEKIDYYVYLVSTFHKQLAFTDEYLERDGRMLLKIYPRSRELNRN